MALLMDAESMITLHRELWSCPADDPGGVVAPRDAPVQRADRGANDGPVSVSAESGSRRDLAGNGCPRCARRTVCLSSRLQKFRKLRLRAVELNFQCRDQPSDIIQALFIATGARAALQHPEPPLRRDWLNFLSHCALPG